MSAATPVPMTAPRSPFLYLVTDPWILISWPLLIGTGLISVLMQLQHPTPPSAFNIIASFLFTGYIFWSAYFGLAGCWRLAISLPRGIASMWFGVGCLSMITFGLDALPPRNRLCVARRRHPHFGRRWWLVHGQHPPFLTAQRQVLYR